MSVQQRRVPACCCGYMYTVNDENNVHEVKIKEEDEWKKLFLNKN